MWAAGMLCIYTPRISPRAKKTHAHFGHQLDHALRAPFSRTQINFVLDELNLTINFRCLLFIQTLLNGVANLY